MTETTGAATPAKPKLSILQQVLCAWPIALVAIGGALGGACGGAAWAINMKIMQSKLPEPARYGLIIVTGLAAIAVYFVAVIALMKLFPSIFAAH